MTSVLPPIGNIRAPPQFAPGSGPHAGSGSVAPGNSTFGLGPGLRHGSKDILGVLGQHMERTSRDYQLGTSTSYGNDNGQQLLEDLAVSQPVAKRMRLEGDPRFTPHFKSGGYNADVHREGWLNAYKPVITNLGAIRQQIKPPLLQGWMTVPRSLLAGREHGIATVATMIGRGLPLFRVASTQFKQMIGQRRVLDDPYDARVPYTFETIGAINQRLYDHRSAVDVNGKLIFRHASQIMNLFSLVGTLAAINEQGPSGDAIVTYNMQGLVEKADDHMTNIWGSCDTPLATNSRCFLVLVKRTKGLEDQERRANQSNDLNGALALRLNHCPEYYRKSEMYWQWEPVVWEGSRDLPSHMYNGVDWRGAYVEFGVVAKKPGMDRRDHKKYRAQIEELIYQRQGNSNQVELQRIIPKIRAFQITMGGYTDPPAQP